MDEHRIALRRRTLKPAKIVFNDRQSVIDCLVRNLSDTGACLEVTSQAGVPPVFELQIESESSNRRCQLIWQSDNKIGVGFTNEAAETSDEDEAGNHSSLRREPARSPGDTSEKLDMVRGELLALRAALDEVAFGVVLLDAALRAQFINRAFRKMWRLSDAKADAKPSFTSLMHHGAETGAYEISSQNLPAYVAERVEAVVSGDTRPRDIRLRSGEVLRFQCAILPAGGRMLNYTYVTDIVRQSDQLLIEAAGAQACLEHKRMIAS
jgi:PAS domain-containing protein